MASLRATDSWKSALCARPGLRAALRAALHVRVRRRVTSSVRPRVRRRVTSSARPIIRPPVALPSARMLPPPLLLHVRALDESCVPCALRAHLMCDCLLQTRRAESCRASPSSRRSRGATGSTADLRRGGLLDEPHHQPVRWQLHTPLPTHAVALALA